MPTIELVTESVETVTFQWTRLVDSLGSTQIDEACFKEMPDGDDLEFGKFNDNGSLKDYEEVWRDVTPRTSRESLAWVLQSTDKTTFLGKVGNIFIAIRQTIDNDFAVRQDEFDGSSWVAHFEHRLPTSPPLSFDIALVDSLLREQQNLSGDRAKICIEGIDYFVLGLENI